MKTSSINARKKNPFGHVRTTAYYLATNGMIMRFHPKLTVDGHSFNTSPRISGLEGRRLVYCFTDATAIPEKTLISKKFLLVR